MRRPANLFRLVSNARRNLDRTINSASLIQLHLPDIRFAFLEGEALLNRLLAGDRDGEVVVAEEAAEVCGAVGRQIQARCGSTIFA